MAQYNLTTPMDMGTLRERIKAELARRNQNYQNLSDVTGIPKSTLDAFLSGRSVPAFDRVYIVCVALGIPLDPSPAEIVIAEPSDRPESYSYAAVQEIRAQYLQEIEEIKNAHAEQNAEREKHLETVKLSRTIWCVVALILIALIVFWLIWDLTHGDRGLIRYDEATGRWIPSLIDGSRHFG